MPAITIARTFHTFDAGAARVTFTAGQAVRLAEIPADQSPARWLINGLARWTVGGVVCAVARWCRL